MKPATASGHRGGNLSVFVVVVSRNRRRYFKNMKETVSLSLAINSPQSRWLCNSRTVVETKVQGSAASDLYEERTARFSVPELDRRWQPRDCSLPKLQTQSKNNRIIGYWHKPGPGWYKLNCDGASKGNPGCAGAGGVLGDSYGAVVAGLELCLQAKAIHQVWVEIDAKVVLQIIDLWFCSWALAAAKFSC